MTTMPANKKGGIVSSSMSGLGQSNSSNSWDDYPEISEEMRASLKLFVTPNVYKKMLVDPSTVENLLMLCHIPFKDLQITKLTSSRSFVYLETPQARAPYRMMFVHSQRVMRCNKLRLLSVNSGGGVRRDSGTLEEEGGIEPLESVSVILHTQQSSSGTRSMFGGFFPVYNLRRITALGERACIFFDKESNRLVLVTTDESAAEQDNLLYTFVRLHGLIHTFDKFCAFCGKAGDLNKCRRCKSVRYCSRECQLGHWPEHKVDCSCSCGGAAATTAGCDVDWAAAARDKRFFLVLLLLWVFCVCSLCVWSRVVC